MIRRWRLFSCTVKNTKSNRRLSFAEKQSFRLFSNNLTKIIPNCSKRKKRWICKPDSVPQRGLYHLSVAAYPPATSEQPLAAGILGLAGDCSYPGHIAMCGCGLLPRIFTLTLFRGGFFLLRFT